MSWLILSIFAGLASNGFNITNRTALKGKGDSTAYAWWFEFVRSLFFLIVILQKPLGNLTLQTIGMLTVVSLTEFFSVYYFMKMHAYTELSISSIISRLRVVWSPLIALLLLGEHLTFVEYLGITAIFLGVSIVTSPKEIKKDKGVKIALIFSFSSALLSTILKLAGGFASSEMIIFSQGVIPLIFMPFLMKNGIERIVSSGYSKFFQIILAGGFNIISSYLLVEALRVADASKVVGLYQAMTIFSVIYGIIILKETDKILLKVIGMIIVLTGVIFTVL